MKKIFLIIILIVSYSLCYSQTKMSKKEILMEWNRIGNLHKKRLEKEYGNQLNRLQVNPKVISYIDSLNKNGVDTIGVYNQVFVGSYSVDSCDNEISPWISYVQWEKEGATFHTTIRQYCENLIVPIPYSTIIKYYNSCPKELKKEKIIPILTGVGKDKNGEPLIEFSMINHTVHYTIFCKQNNDSIHVNFTEYELTEKRNLFFEENNESRIKSWLNMIENQIQEINNE